MNTKRAAQVVASMRSQATDVQIGIITKAEWNRRFDAAVAEGVEFPEALRNYRGV